METQSYNSHLIDRIKLESSRCKTLQQEVAKLIVGQEDIITFIMISILCRGHILLEGVPGVAKTTMIKAIAQALGLAFKRIQFTPDLLPADLIGTLVYDPKTQEFQTKKGPIFSNLILADEINRTPAKVQAALLEAMGEGQVTIGGQTFTLDTLFFVLATQNPIEQEGTYKLPEAQVDRFMFKLIVPYPKLEHEKEIIRRTNTVVSILQIISKEEILALQQLVNDIYVDEKIISYIAHIVNATRIPEDYGLPHLRNLIEYGLSPRASKNLYNAAKGLAFLRQRHFVTPDDVKAVAFSTLRHRLPLTYEAEAQGITADFIIQTILNTISSP